MTDHIEGETEPILGSYVKGNTLAQILLVVACVGLADWLFYDHPVGWTLGAFGAVSGAGIAWLGEARYRALPSVLLGACFFALCLRAVFDPDPLVIFLGLAAWVAFTLTLRGGWSWSLTCWLGRGALFFWGLVKAYFSAAGVLTLLPLAPLLALLKVRRLRAWLIPLMLGLVFLGLFALANPVLSRALKSVGEGFEWLCDQLPALVSLPRIFLWLTFGAWLWTLLRHTSRGGEGSAAGPVPPPLPACGRVLTPEVIRNALVVFNALFAFQTMSDLWYLWGGGALPQGMTYAEYAHRGAYPLVVTALLAGAFVLVTFREGSAAAEIRVTRCLVYAWLIQNVFLVASAGWRLGLYVSVFSLSRLRLAAGVWMFLVACGLVWIFARIFARRPNLWLIKANVVTALTVLTAYGLWTPNMFIAEFNVRHCRETGHPTAQPIDLRYLSRLGYDALPALVRLEREVQDQPLARKVRPVIDRLSKTLDARLGDWRGVTLKRRYLRGCLERECRPEPNAVEAAARQSTP
ncbi:MAG TPA: DUF4173 domain-containing protein [Kiritimatiellia bacterium]|nr:DUF4173 domain-containing protein [Kiritimatiellia bacterium]HPS09141.1 DUF4173 domain-containing protein [Kiritimatiellia bacterium]